MIYGGGVVLCDAVCVCAWVRNNILYADAASKHVVSMYSVFTLELSTRIIDSTILRLRIRLSLAYCDYVSPRLYVI